MRFLNPSRFVVLPKQGDDLHYTEDQQRSHFDLQIYKTDMQSLIVVIFKVT